MRLRRILTALALAICLAPISGLADGIFNFSIPTRSLLGATPIVSSVKASGGTSHGNATVSITDGLLDVTSSNPGWLRWNSGGSLEITGTSSIHSLILSGDLLDGSFTGLSFPRMGEVSLNDFSGTINPALAAYYGLSGTAVSADVHLGLRHIDLAIHVGDPVVAAAEGGGLGATMILLLAAVLCFAAGVRWKLIRQAY